jgi:hypothetical protein
MLWHVPQAALKLRNMGDILNAAENTAALFRSARTANIGNSLSATVAWMERLF